VLKKDGGNVTEEVTGDTNVRRSESRRIVLRVDEPVAFGFRSVWGSRVNRVELVCAELQRDLCDTGVAYA